MPCEATGSHVDHVGRDADGKLIIWWPNTEVEVPVHQPPGRRRTNHDEARKLAKEVRADQAAHEAEEATRDPARLVLGPIVRTNDPPSAYDGADYIKGSEESCMWQVVHRIRGAYPEWINGNDLEGPGQGGDQGLRRLRAAKGAGILNYETRRPLSGHGTFDYRWKPADPPVPTERILRDFDESPPLERVLLDFE